MRILLIRTSALGDVVQALPVLTALGRHLPEAEVGWVIEEPFRPLLEGHSGIAALLPVRLRAWRRSPGSRTTRTAMRRALGAPRAFRADAVLDLMGNHKAGALALLSGCPRRLGLERRARREPWSALWINERLPSRGEHAVERMLSVLAGLGLPEEPVDFGGEKLFADPAHTEAAVRAEAVAAPLGAGPLAVVLPGAGWGNKTYPARWLGEVARILHAERGVASLVPAGPGEEALAEAVAAASASPGGEPAAHAAGLVDLPTLGALLRRAHLVLGGDTGPLHLAHALGTPVLCLMGPTDPARHGPYGAPERALWHRLPCSFCHQRFAEPKACLLTLPPARVAARALELL